ncbi:murein L,D-transpeptidase [Paenimyroides tangerinum]|uniref:Murein L,D-transpeptidase n=1 Tax=Paenimyroides tangerinum TaxID=2488728 RepID=A0A3P3W8V1_9FLAO|nr:L,D-transpeptidase [Paenimyroides tangerinum]RRJ89083.1 murein L,D-transpeptidase [Paenimyroides tangerinum]
MKKIINSILFVGLLIFTVACDKANPNSKQTEDTKTDNERAFQIRKDSLEKAKQDSIVKFKQDSITEIKDKFVKKEELRIKEGAEYDYWPLKKSDSLSKKFFKTYSKDEIYTIAALNRVDVANLKGRDTIIVPKVIKEDFLDYSPFPYQMEILTDVPKFIVFSYPIQAFAVYENGNLIKWGPTNMGKKATQTPRGLFFTNWRGRKVKSTSNSEWILNWNFNISNHGGVGFHQYALPGYPASHSCLRLLDADAQFLYNWCDQWILKDANTQIAKGTPVIVYGDYAFGKKGVWNDLVKDPNATLITTEQLKEVVEPHIAEIIKQQEIRINYLKNKDTEVKNDSLKTLDKVMSEKQ